RSDWGEVTSPLMRRAPRPASPEVSASGRTRQSTSWPSSTSFLTRKCPRNPLLPVTSVRTRGSLAPGARHSEFKMRRGRCFSFRRGARHPGTDPHQGRFLCSLTEGKETATPMADKKTADESKPKRKPNAGFMKPMQPSPDLAKIVGDSP